MSYTDILLHKSIVSSTFLKKISSTLLEGKEDAKAIVNSAISWYPRELWHRKRGICYGTEDTLKACIVFTFYPVDGSLFIYIVNYLASEVTRSAIKPSNILPCPCCR